MCLASDAGAAAFQKERLFPELGSEMRCSQKAEDEILLHDGAVIGAGVAKAAIGLEDQLDGARGRVERRRESAGSARRGRATWEHLAWRSGPGWARAFARELRR